MINYLHNINDIEISPLANRQLDVWLLSISKILEDYERLKHLLVDDEIQKALSFHHQKDQRQNIISRGLLRYFIMHYLQIDNEHIDFGYEKYGKPFLLDNTLQFNISHSDDLIAFAFSNLGRVGIDIEYKCAIDKEFHMLLSLISSEAELMKFRQIPDEQKYDAFYYLWTVKEAYGKALGKGLHDGLRDIDMFVSENPLMSSWELLCFKNVGNYFVLGGFPLQSFAGALVADYLPDKLNFKLLL